MNDDVEDILKKIALAYLKVFFLELPGGTGEKIEGPRPRFAPRSHSIQNRSVSNSSNFAVGNSSS
jgi:hypothetical protein